jgi:hypothetical protein
VIVTGADLITEWQREDPERHIYSTPWPHRFIGWNERHVHPDDDRHLVIGRCEQVFVNNYLLRQVLTRGEVSRGTFYVDLASKRLYVWNADNGDPTKTDRYSVEASSRGLVWHSKGGHVHVRGIRFRYAANMAQHGAVVVEGNHCVLEDCVVRNCLVADNEGAGIFHEISYGLHAHDNVIVGNGFDAGFGAWGACGGISISSSPGCVVDRNLIVGNREGFQYRGTRRIGPDGKKAPGGVPVWNHDQTVRQNVLAYNRDAQAWGWFDVRDGRHWPRAPRPSLPAEEGRSPEDIAAEYEAKNREGHPTDLTLEKLKLVHEGNLFFPGPGQQLFNWGTTWLHHKRYAALDEVRGELSLENGSRRADPGLVDYLTRDFRAPPESPALGMGCYPRGEVPGVRLGVVGGR